MTFDLDLHLQGHFGLGLENRVRSVASTALDGFFPYLIQMIPSMRRCVTYDDLWPWTTSSRSFDLDIENRVRSITFSVLDRLFPYLPQVITTIRGCVACLVKGLITVGRELRQQHPSDLLFGAGTSRERRNKPSSLVKMSPKQWKYHSVRTTKIQSSMKIWIELKWWSIV